MNGDLLEANYRVIRKKSIENIIASIINGILKKNKKHKLSHIAIYSDNMLVLEFINKIIDDRNHDGNRKVRYHPRGVVFRNIKRYGVRIMLFGEPQGESFTIVQNNAIFALREEKG